MYKNWREKEKGYIKPIVKGTLESLERVTKREVLCLEERWKQALVSSVRRNSNLWHNNKDNDNKQFKCSKHFLKVLYEIQLILWFVNF